MDMQYSLMLPYKFYKVDGENTSNICPGTSSSMMESYVQVYCENYSSFNGVMSDKMKVRHFPWNTETAARSVTLLIVMKSNLMCSKSLAHTLLYQEELSYTAYMYGCPVPYGARNDKRHASPTLLPLLMSLQSLPLLKILWLHPVII